ncbi:MAG: sigma-70 family RNA polymerase sigma factor [Planctomycetes bacterium]|nr:sigma-70 family RNA polymerase sigma factor [Planctomycetota bacterium]
MTVETDNSVEQANQQCLKGLAAKAYASGQKKHDPDKMVIEYLPMVGRIVDQVTTYIKPPLTKEDLVSAGSVGLVKAARDFDPTRNAEFKTYAYIRVKGAIIDELRSWSFAPANLSKQIQQAEEISRENIEKTGFIIEDEKLAGKMDITVDKLYKIFENARSRHFMSIHGLNDDEPALGDVLIAHKTDTPESAIEKRELASMLAECITNLPEKQRQVIILYYHQELTMKEASLALEVTESRVSQLHASAIFSLSSQLKEYDDGR